MRPASLSYNLPQTAGLWRCRQGRSHGRICLFPERGALLRQRSHQQTPGVTAQRHDVHLRLLRLRLAVLEGTPVFAGFAMTLLSAGFLLPFIVWRRDRLESLRVHRGGLWVRGFLEVGFMVCKLYAIRELQAPYVVGMQRLSLVFSIIGGRIFFGEQDTLRRLLAAVLIIAGVFWIAWMEFDRP